MIETDTYLSTFFWVRLCFFTFVSVAIMLATIVKVVRLKNIRLQWNGGKLGGYPLFSTFFLAFLIGMSIIAYVKNSLPGDGMIVSYLILGTSWFCTSFFMSRVYITDHGIVKNINDTLQTLAWHQVRDFIEYEKEGKTLFTFLYFNEANRYINNSDNDKIIRLDVEIPFHKLRQFRKIVSYKLGRRFDYHYVSDSEIKEQYR